MKKQFRRIVAGALIIMVSVCTFMLGSGKSLANGTVKVSLLGKYDSADTATVRKVDTNTKQIQFRNFDTGKGYTLSYDNTSYMYDEYDKAISAALLEEGDICEITFLKSSKHLNSLTISKDAFVLNDVTEHDLIRGDETAKINGKIYHLSNKALIMADGKPILAENVLDTDTIQVTGLDKEIYSIVVTKGHGYVSLSSDVVGKRSLVGAWLELDNEVIRKITPNMMVSAPEGTYTLSILGQGANYNSTVDVERNKETVIDTSVIPVEQPKEGQVTFEVTPDNAKVYVDGTQIITGVPQTFEYGVHKLQAFADGYDTFTRKLKVAQETAVIEITMEKTEDSSSTGSSNSSTNSSNKTNTSNSNSSNASVKGASATKSNTGSSQNKTTTTADKSISTAASTGKSASSSGKASSSSSTTSSTDDSSAAYTYVTTDTTTSSSTESSTTVTTDDDDDDTEETYQIFVNAPVGAELYLDGDYVGIIPTVFSRSEGKYMVTLAKSGYETKSYTISIDSGSDNSTYTFPDLVAEDSDSDDSSTTDDTSDNSTSDTSADAATTDSTTSEDDSSDDSTTDTSSSDASNAATTAVSDDNSDEGDSEDDDSQSPDITSNSADENTENP